MKHCTLTIIALLLCTFSFAQGPISGPSAVCDGNTITLSNSTLGGTWTSSALTVATVSATTGIVTGISIGVTTITYTVGASFVTHPVTVNPLPTPIGGLSTVCEGSSISLFNAVSGGTWSSSSIAIAPIGAATGVLTGVAAGTTVVTYTLSTGCFTTKIITVNPLPGTITGPLSVCVGSSVTLSSFSAGGMWTTASASASIGSITGMVTGFAAGTPNITYTLPTGCFTTRGITVNPLPATIVGSSSVCVGSSITLSSAAAGGTWSSSMPSVAPIGTATGVLTGVSAGTTAVTYTLGTGCSTVKIITVNPSPGPITGPSSICAGGSVSLSIGTGGGAWTSPSITVAVVGSTGLVTGVSASTVTISYTLSTLCSSTKSFTVTPTPTIYTMTGGSGGTASFCSGGAGVSFGLSGSDPGVSYVLWQSGVGTAIGPIIGTGSALSFGPVTSPGLYCIMAYPGTSCLTIMNDSITLAVSPLPTTHTVSGGGTYCTGSSGVTIGLSSSDVGINYLLYVSGVPASTPVAGTGTALSFSGITTAGTYTFIATDATTSCVTAMSGSAIVTLSSLPTITTSSTYPCGGAQTITASGGVTYSWAPTTGLSCSACGVTDATPATTTTYTVTGTGAGGCTNTATVSVNANRIAGQLTYSGGSSTDVFKVWLIQFNPSDSSITALDSTTTCMLTGSVPYYEFVSPAAGSYLVKAKLNGTIAGTSGYIPTYGLSTPNWYAAASVSHTTARDNMNISMVYGTVPSGPGFISGYVVSGAGKGTAGDIPEPGMLIYLYNTSGSMITYTYTDAAGVYSFTGLAAGTYYIYPEAHKYYTTPSATITLSGSSTSAVGIGFRKSTTLGTIKPYDNTQILGTTTNATLAVYPVPTSRILYIEWPVTTTAHTVIVVRDMKGATVYSTEVDPSVANYHSELNLNTLPDGIYHITIRSSDIFYTSKLMIAH